MLLLREDVIQINEHGSHLPTVYAVLFRRANQAQPGDLH
jgi:hypothetical protein